MNPSRRSPEIYPSANRISFSGPPRVWEQLRQSITAKFGGADALKAALEADQAGVQALVVGALGFEEVDYFLTAAAPTPPALIHWWESVGVNLCEGFGQTEAMGLIATDPADRRVGSIGRPVGEVEVKIGDNDEMLIKAEGCTPGYYNRPEEDRRAMARRLAAYRRQDRNRRRRLHFYHRPRQRLLQDHSGQVCRAAPHRRLIRRERALRTAVPAGSRLLKNGHGDRRE